MRLRVLALDFDGTIADERGLEPRVRSAIEYARGRGIVVLLVTGRILSDLRCKLGKLDLFDAIVGENGAVLAFPGAGRSLTLAPRIGESFVQALRARNPSAISGECVVELDAGAAGQCLTLIREMQLPLTLHFNRGRLMILPQSVSKATGLREALRILRLSGRNAVAVGDAENDHELLQACEVGAAVAWGSAALRASADLIVDGTGPADVAAFVKSVASAEHIVIPARARRRLVLGRERSGALLELAVRGRNALVAGDPRSGKSWVAGLLGEQLILQGYSLCILDPEGDYASLEGLPGVLLLGGDSAPPTMQELTRLLRHADVSVIVDLARQKSADKRDYILRALVALTELRRATGVPHRILVDEAHYFLHDPAQASLLDRSDAGYTLVTYCAGRLHPDVLTSSECVVATRMTDATDVEALHRAQGGSEGLDTWKKELGSLELGEAALLPGSAEAQGRLRRFQVSPRTTSHVRHRHKYLDVPVCVERAFQFRIAKDGQGPRVASLQELVDVLEGTSREAIDGHVQRGDFSRWVEDVFQDETLAAEMRELEERYRLKQLPDVNGALIHAVRSRYGPARGGSLDRG
jgi:hypothetical protein